MSDRLQQICEAEFSRYAQRLANAIFDTASQLPGADEFMTTPLVEIPITGEQFFAGYDSLEMRQRVAAALVARERFRLCAPWAPSLPLKWKECQELEHDDNPRLKLVGLYASSLHGAYWDDAHPCFPVFACGVMAHPLAPDALRNDPDLQQEFPPYPLEGLCDELDWRSSERLALDQRMRVMQAHYDARMGRPPAPVT